MPITLPQTFKDEGERPQGSKPWIWLLEVEVSRGDVGVPAVLFRITTGETELRWPITAAGTGTGYLVNNVGGYGVGATSIAVDTGTGTILAGDLIKFANHETRYTVTTGLSGGVVVIASPGLVQTVADNEAVEVGPTEVWYPFPFIASPIEQNNEGDLPQLSVSVDNTGRFLSRYLHSGNGLEGNRAKLILVPTGALTIQYPNHEFQSWEFRIAEAQATEVAIAMRLQNPNFLSRMSPFDRYVPSRCRWDYGGQFCGYVLNVLAAFQVCPKTIDACIARGEDMIARGYGADILPGNYGGHPGVSVRR